MKKKSRKNCFYGFKNRFTWRGKECGYIWMESFFCFSVAYLRHFFGDSGHEAGCDEAGRGCLAGPVAAAAVVLPRHCRIPGLGDSKLLTEAERNRLRTIIKRKALAWHVAFVGPEEIDRINILQASISAMHAAVDGLSIRPDLLLIDGNRFNTYSGIEHRCIIGGDGRYAAIAAASILAKTYRDEEMCRLHEAFPQYGWAHNKAYCTKDHQAALRTHGPCAHHRKSFRLDYGVRGNEVR